jgi:uncharacterized protein
MPPAAESGEPGSAVQEPGIHVIAKPVGPYCNLNCEYCFYLEKQALFRLPGLQRMPDDVLSAFIQNYISCQPSPVVEFVWQGGEPTLAGLDFYSRAFELQKRYSGSKTISNSLQTNGTLLTDDWCRFFKKHDVMVGISLDGPRELNDRYRYDLQGAGTFDRTLHGLRLLQKHGVTYNVLASVTRETARRPLEVYAFFKEQKIEYIQFTPIVERRSDTCGVGSGLRLAGPWQQGGTDVTPWSVVAEEYGDFLIAIYEEWVRHDVGNVFVMNFEWALNAWIGNPSPVCIHAAQCGRSVVVECNGDVYACDHYVYPQYTIGNVGTDTFTDMIDKSLLSGFGVTKQTGLPNDCRECAVLAACRGGCPKQRFISNRRNEAEAPYLCAGYKKFYLHIRKYLGVLTTLLENNLPAAYIMDACKGPLTVKLHPP